VGERYKLHESRDWKKRVDCKIVMLGASTLEKSKKDPHVSVNNVMALG